MKQSWAAARVLAALLTVAACGSDEVSESTAFTPAPTASTTRATTVAVPATLPPDTMPAVTGVSYVSQSGDTVFTVAVDRCTTPQRIVNANGWSDGVEHSIDPGSVIRLPAEACSPPELSDTTSPPDAEGCGCEEIPVDLEEEFSDPIRRLATIQFAFNMLSGTNAGQFSDPECVAAYATGLKFEQGLGSKAATLTALSALSDELPLQLTTYIEVWDEFIREHGVDAMRIIATYDSQGEEAALADPSLDEVAYALRDNVWSMGRRRVSEFVNGTCAPHQL
jgi:hypothetical protein